MLGMVLEDGHVREVYKLYLYLFYMILFHFILFYFILFFFILFYFILFCFILFYITKARDTYASKNFIPLSNSMFLCTSE